MFRNPLTKWGKHVANLSHQKRFLKRMRYHRVVPDVIPTLPQVILDVSYGGHKLDMGNILTPAATQEEPTVHWDYEPDVFYSLCLINPDAPSRKSPLFRHWHHWLIGNIPENSVSHGEELAQYIGPIPAQRTGLHRYVFLVYKQPNKIQFKGIRLTNKRQDHRSLFSLRRFVKKYKLGYPLAGNFFQAEWDESVPKTRRRLSRFNFVLSMFVKD